MRRTQQKRKYKKLKEGPRTAVSWVLQHVEMEMAGTSQPASAHRAPPPCRLHRPVAPSDFFRNPAPPSAGRRLPADHRTPARNI